MLSSKKILYLIILSLIVICGINGIDYYEGAYDAHAGFSDEIITFSDSGFFDVPDPGSTVAIVSEDGGEGGGNADVYIPSEVNITTTTSTIQSVPDDVTTLPSEITTISEQPTTEWTTGSTTTQTTTTTVRTTTTTTTTTVPTTTTTAPRVFYDSGQVHFDYQTIRIYAGASVNVSLSFPIGSQRRATFSSKDTTVASVTNFDDTTALITGLSVGTAWIQATSSSGEVAYCKVLVTDFASEVIRLTNIERANYGLPALAEGGPLVQSVANIRLSESSSYFSHTRPNGKKFSTAAQDVGLTYNKLGENLAAWQTTPEQVVADWMASPSHRENILDSDYTNICVAYGIGSDGRPYWVQIFFRPLS